LSKEALHRLLKKLYNKKIPIRYIKWVKSFLSDRQAVFSVDSIRGNCGDVNNGTPQGSPISPILNNYNSSDLLDIFDKGAVVRPNTSLIPLELTIYIDDGSIRAVSHSISQNCALLERGFKIVNDYMIENKLTLDPKKREMMYFHNKQDLTGTRNTVCLACPDGSTQTLAPLKTLRWLGIFFDSKLLWTDHINTLTERATSAVLTMSILGNSQKGLSANNLRKVYLQSVVPIMTYASPVWFSGIKQKSRVDKLQKVQNQAMRKIAGAFRTTNVEALESIFSLPPMVSVLAKINYKYATRLQTMDKNNNPVIARLIDWRGPNPEVFLPIIDEEASTNLTRLGRLGDKLGQLEYKQSFPPWTAPLNMQHFIEVRLGPKKKSKEYALKVNNMVYQLESEGHLIAFTNGSKHDSATGAAFWASLRTHKLTEVSTGLGERATALDAEVLAIKTFSDWIFEQFSMNDIRLRSVFNISIVSDCKPAIQLITGPCPKVNREWWADIKRNLETLHERYGLNFIFIWAPGHANILGNEIADTLAKEAVNLPSSVSSTTSYCSEMADKLCLATWKRFRINTKRSQSTWITRKRSLKATKLLKNININRETLSRYVQTMTTHGHNVNYYRCFLPNHIAEGQIDPVCHTCGVDSTIQHVLQDCKKYDKQRPILRNILKTNDRINVKSLVSLKEGRKAFASFLVKSGAFTKDGQIHVAHLSKPIRRTGLPAPYIPPIRKPPDRSSDGPSLGSAESIESLLSQLSAV
jgi:ribonuclease HI